MFMSVTRKSTCISKCTIIVLEFFLPPLAGSDARLPLRNVYITILLKFIAITKTRPPFILSNSRDVRAALQSSSLL